MVPGGPPSAYYIYFHAQTYIRPKASSKELLMVTRVTVACFGMLTGVVAIILFVVRTR